MRQLNLLEMLLEMLENSIRNFWRNRNFLNYCLLPFSIIYSLYFHFRILFASPKRVKAKVICVGNVTVGGAGKTPFCIALAKSYIKRGKKVAFLSRGYKGSLSTRRKAYKVTDKHTYKEVGDEPLLLSEVAPTYICPDRYKSAKLAIADGAKILIMDDGLQNFTLEQDEKILLIDANYNLGNGLLLPAGPLRENLDYAIRRTTNMYVIGKKIPANLKKYKPLLCQVSVENAKNYKGKKYITMCGIANPDKFQTTVKSLKIKVAKNFYFPDHFKYNPEALAEVVDSAVANKCKILTTTKDFVKIPDELQKHFEVLSISIKLN